MAVVGAFLLVTFSAKVMSTKTINFMDSNYH